MSAEIHITEDERREYICRCAIQCENALYRADYALRHYRTVRARFVGAATHLKEAALLAEGAFWWANAEVRA